MAKIKKRSDGRYQSNIIIGRKLDGSYIRKYIYGKTKKKLEEKIEEIKHQLKIGININDESTFKDMAEIWLAHYRKNQSGIWAIRQQAIVEKILLPAIGHKRIKDITKYDLQSLINSMKENNAATSTMKKVKIVASQVFEVALDKKIVIENPFKKVFIETIQPKLRRALSEEEIDLVTRTWKDHRIGYVAMVLLYCGLRRGEVMALNWSDVDFKDKVIHVTAVTLIHGKPLVKGPKSKAGIRDVPIPNFLRIY